MSIPSSWSYPYRFNRCLYFFLFFLANTSISFLSFPTFLLFAIGVSGLVLPTFIAWRASALPIDSQPPLYKWECFQSIPLYVPLIGFVFCVFLRFFHLETLFAWPNGDEGWVGTNAIELAKQWSWKFFYTTGEVPPLPIWAVAAMFKAAPPPFLSLWFPT